MGRHSDSDEERPKPKRQKRFTFRTFEQRVANVRQRRFASKHVMQPAPPACIPCAPAALLEGLGAVCRIPGRRPAYARRCRHPAAGAAAARCLPPPAACPHDTFVAPLVFHPPCCPQVEVDVYRSLGPKRAEPLPGSTSFFQEGLNKWRELNSAEHWVAAASALSPLCQTLPLLVHHREEVLEVLLGGLRMEAVLSLEPLLELIGTLARDLQADFLPALGRVLTALADLVDEGEWSEGPGSSCMTGWRCLDDAAPGAGAGAWAGRQMAVQRLVGWLWPDCVWLLCCCTHLQAWSASRSSCSTCLAASPSSASTCPSCWRRSSSCWAC